MRNRMCVRHMVLAPIVLLGAFGAAFAADPATPSVMSPIPPTDATQTLEAQAAADAAYPAEKVDNPDLLALKARVLARWKALIARDYSAVYGFTSPTYRAAFSKEHYLSRFAEQVKRESVDVYSLEYNNPEQTAARVRVVIHYLTELGGAPFRGESGDWEYWVKESGEWWLSPAK